MPQLSDIFQSADVKKKDVPQSEKIKLIHYTKLHDNRKQYCDEKDKEEIIRLAHLIEADDGVLQPLLIRKVDTDEYEIIAGHKRRRAVRYLVEEKGKVKYEFLPCICKNISDVRAEFQLYSSNGFHLKTEYEIMHELENMKHLLEEHPEEFPNLESGRMVEKLAQQLHMKKTTVGEYLTISKNLGKKGMEAFKEGTLKKTAAVEISGLSKEEQDTLLDAGVTAHKDIKAYKNKITNKDMEDEIAAASPYKRMSMMIHDIKALALPENEIQIHHPDKGSKDGTYVKVSDVIDIIKKYQNEPFGI